MVGESKMFGEPKKKKVACKSKMIGELKRKLLARQKLFGEQKTKCLRNQKSLAN